jgi:hypothetical protein
MIFHGVISYIRQISIQPPFVSMEFQSTEKGFVVSFRHQCLQQTFFQCHMYYFMLVKHNNESLKVNIYAVNVDFVQICSNSCNIQ